MIVVKAPLRVSLFGGGTDLPEYADIHNSVIISFAINKYIYVTLNERPTGGCRVSYSQVEELGTFRNARHTLVRAWAEKYSPPEPSTLTITSDLPKGTGLGSSSALAVCLCGMWDVWRQEATVDQAAYELERTVSPVGFQDHLPATFGGFRVYVGKPEFVSQRPMPSHMDAMIERYGILLYTGLTRESAPILQEWKTDPVLHDIKSLAEEVAGKRWTLSGKDIGLYLDRTWKMKSCVPGVSSEALRSQYEKALACGVWGGKLLGAGGGGCWFFMAPVGRRQLLVESLGLTEIPFRIAHEGVEKVEV